jgi:hypothetical protein
MNAADNEQRQRVIDLVLSARTDELAAAEDAADRWMAEHPDDFGIVIGLEQVVMIRNARNHWTSGAEDQGAGSPCPLYLPALTGDHGPAPPGIVTELLL